MKSSGIEIGRYGLPLKIKYCRLCNISNQQPTSTNEYLHNKNTIQKPLEFDEEEICHACKINKNKNKIINWKEREEQLKDIAKKYKNHKSQYNCLVPGSGGKDSAFQAHVLKYKYGMRPLTITWAPHLYTNIGWSNFQNWIHIGGFDNLLFTPNGKLHRYLTEEALRNLLHPFQPFIIGQKHYPLKIAHQFNIPIIFYGESASEYGSKLTNEKNFSTNKDKDHSGFLKNPISNMNIQDVYLAGKTIKEHLENDKRFNISDFKTYLPLDENKIDEKKIEIQWLGYYLKWVPQENFYYATENTGFKPNTERIEGTYQKYASIDDKTDGFFYYTRFIKFGVGRAMMDSSMEVRNDHINKEEGLSLIKKFDGEFPKKFEKEFLEYVSMSREEFDEICDKFRPDHIWEKKSNRWELKNPPWEYFN